MDLQLQNKVIVVTGGAKGIGLGVAEILAAERAIPVIIGRNPDDNQRAVSQIEAAGHRA
ncbi:SDR family NAD(P)-dependent oxidoreductase, partial [Acinetobacter baumannii]